MIKVLNIKGYEDGVEYDVFVQKITLKTICVIMNDDLVLNFRRSDGKCRNAKLKLAYTSVEKFLKINRQESWDGGWKPVRNSRNEVVRKMAPFSGNFQTWFKQQNVKIIQV